MMRQLIAIVVGLMPVLAFAQSSDTVFTVKAPSGTIRLLPETDRLYRGITHRFTCSIPSGLILDSVSFQPGTATLRDSILLLQPTVSGTALLKVYAHFPAGNPMLVLVKEYKVIRYLEPAPNVDGVDNDSAIHRMKIVAQGYLNVPVNANPLAKRISYPVISFEMHHYEQGQADTLRANGNRLSYGMKDKIDHMKGGNAITFTNIRYKLMDDTLTISQPFRVFIINDTIFKF